MPNRKLFAEFIGTFAIVFCGTGAIVIDEQTHGLVSHIGVAITFGLIVMVMIYAFGETSGAHFNPAVTLGFAVANQFDKKLVLPFIFSQIAGAFLATMVLKFLFPGNVNLGSTIPAGSQLQSFVLEFFLTYLLLLVIFQVSSGSKEKGILAGMAIGAMVGLEALFAGPICGASMNPARSLAPAIVSGNIESLWIYIVAPTSGAIASALTMIRINEMKKKEKKSY